MRQFTEHKQASLAYIRNYDLGSRTFGYPLNKNQQLETTDYKHTSVLEMGKHYDDMHKSQHHPA